MASVADGLGVQPRLDRQVAQEHVEALALARDHVAGPHRRAQPRADLAQQLVSQLGPERVVDAPEVVDVHERERHRGPGDAGSGDRVAERVGRDQDGV
jgi:hypothetical protein